MIADSAARAVTVERVACVVCGAFDDTEPIASGYDYEHATTDLQFTFGECRRCRHCFLNPRPTIESASIIYPADYYTRTGEHAAEGSPLLARIKDFVVMRRARALIADLPNGGAVLDVGAGDGALLTALRRRRSDLRLTALDFSFSGAQRERLAAAGIDCVESPLDAASLPRGVFDLVIMNQVIEHLWDVRGGLSKIRESLSDRGRLSVSTPNLFGYDRAMFGRYWGAYYMPRHLNLFSAVSLRRLLADTGFDVLTIQPLAAPLVWVRSFQYLFKARRSSLHALFTDHNLPALAAFAAADGVMSLVGCETSNLHCLAAPRASVGGRG